MTVSWFVKIVAFAKLKVAAVIVPLALIFPLAVIFVTAEILPENEFVFEDPDPNWLEPVIVLVAVNVVILAIRLSTIIVDAVMWFIDADLHFNVDDPKS